MEEIMADFSVIRCEICRSRFKVDFDKGLKFICPNCRNMIEYLLPVEKENIEEGDLIEDNKKSIDEQKSDNNNINS